MHSLAPHPDRPAKAVRAVRVKLARSGSRGLVLDYEVIGTRELLLPDTKTPGRADDLWQSTCFELFVRPAGSDSYLEFNFSPSFQWAAYAFDHYRSGRRDLPAHDPEISVTPAGDHFLLAVEALPELPPGPLKLGLSAVIEEVDGTKSYWALRHPPGAPDFHHADCFALELRAAKAA